MCVRDQVARIPWEWGERGLWGCACEVSSVLGQVGTYATVLDGVFFLGESFASIDGDSDGDIICSLCVSLCSMRVMCMGAWSSVAAIPVPV